MKHPWQPGARRAAFISLLCALLLQGAILPVSSQQPAAVERYSIAYRMSMTRPESHLFEIEIAVETPTAQEYVEFQMPRWSPGRYAVFDFAKNAQEFRAASGICPQEQSSSCDQPALPVTRMDNQTWRVATNGARQLTIRYKVFGDDLSGTHSQLDARHASFNGGSVFMYVVGHKQDPVSLSIAPPQNWRIVNAYTARPDQREFQFANYDVLIDTPTEISPDWTLDEFRVDGKLYRVVVHSFGEEGGKRPELVRGLERIVRAQTAMWGPPEFDSYTFLIHFAADDRSSDAMEHLNSTQIVESGALADEGMLESALDSASHEFFHVWNVKRLRPRELGPWDFTRPLNTRSLWIVEGVTNYYGHLMQRRAGLWSDAEYLSTLSRYITGVENAPGTRLTSVEETSVMAPFIDRARHAQRTNLENTVITYYWKGEVLAATLDLLIRGRTGGRASLDDVLRRMYEEFYLRSPNDSYYLRGRGYTNEDFERMVATVGGADFADFFRRYVRGTETPPYEEAFAQVGLRLTRRPASAPYTAGIALESGDAPVIRNIRPDSAAERAGLNRGDRLISIGGTPVTSANWRSVLNRQRAGARVPVTVRRDRQTIQATLTLGPPDAYDYVVEARPDATPQARALRAAWLSGSR